MENPYGQLDRHDRVMVYEAVMRDNDRDTMRLLCQTDLFFLLTVAFRRKDVDRPWLFERCVEVEKDPDGYLDLWAREHYKSTIITYAKTIQDILCDPTLTVGIFSCTRPLAKDFLGQIKTELEENEFLKDLFPDVLYANPQRDAPSWSLDNGIIVKRRTNSREATVEAWGMVEGLPVGKHFRLVVYDDVISERHVTTPDMLEKVRTQWELSLNLGAQGGTVRYVGTRYHFNDTYRTIIERGAAVLRLHPATHDGTVGGEPVLLSQEQLDKKHKEQGSYIYACQMLLNPVADSSQGFHEDWLRWYETASRDPDRAWNVYVLCDPANEKKKDNDYTVITVVALAPDGNYYLIDAIRDRLNLTERTNAIFRMHEKYHPVAVGYEHYGIQADIQHIQYVQEQRNYRFPITPVGGQVPKEDRIRRLVPVFEFGRFWFPRRLLFTTVGGKAVDWVREFVKDEFTAFPVAVHDDMLDCLSRIVDPLMGAKFPVIHTEQRRSSKARVADSEFNPYAA